MDNKQPDNKRQQEIQRHNITDKAITVSWLRENLASTIGQDLIKNGFSIDARKTKLRKKINKNTIEIHFDCYTYATKLEFRLLIFILIPEIENEQKKFDHFRKRDYSKGWTFTFSEGGFHPTTKHLEPKYRTAAMHIVNNQKTLDEEILDCRTVLHKYILPVLPIFSDLHDFQEFTLKDPSLVIHLGVMLQALMSTKLKGKSELLALSDLLDKELKSLENDISQGYRSLLQEFIRYSEEVN